MHLLALSFSAHTTIRLEEVGALLGAVAGALLALGAVTPLGRRAGELFGGIALAAGSVLVILALHWGT
ncbi:MAG TPA: hypothetical protein VEG24_03560 [Gaiellaceae bacterium]|nr:hypothetical protein [Gaiellaceae bacterium]